MLILVSIVAFATLYTIGNIMSLSSTLFLMGPLRQLKSMFDPTRLFATIIFIASMAMTLFCAFWVRNNTLLIYSRFWAFNRRANTSWSLLISLPLVHQTWTKGPPNWSGNPVLDHPVFGSHLVLPQLYPLRSYRSNQLLPWYDALSDANVKGRSFSNLLKSGFPTCN